MAFSAEEHAGWNDVELGATGCPLGHLLLAGARQWPDREAVVFPDERWSYRFLADRSWDIARSLAGLGIERGDHVGVLMGNGPEVIASLFGITLLGAVHVPINARYRKAELAFLVGDADLRAVLTFNRPTDRVDYGELLWASLGVAGSQRSRRLDLDQYPELHFVAGLGSDAPRGILTSREFSVAGIGVDEAEIRDRIVGVALRDVAMIVYTSGTTAQPRGAILTHEGFVRTWMEAGRRFGCVAGDRFWTPLPLFHVAGLGPMTFTLGVGGTFVSDYWFDPERSLREIERERATLLYPTYPALVQSMLNHPKFPDTDLSAVRAYCAIAPPETLKQCQAALPHASLITTYGGTEPGILTMTDHRETDTQRTTTCGLPLPGLQIKIVDPETLAPLSVGEPGEILMRGYNTFEGYYKQPLKTAEAKLPGGWIRVGDRGRIDGDGRLLFLGRIKDMMKVGGENVAPAEIESFLMTHPAVQLAQVIGGPHPTLDEVPVAFVELVEGASLTEDDLRAFCTGQIASFKVPRQFRFVKEWPMSATKIQRFALRDQLEQEGTAE